MNTSSTTPVRRQRRTAEQWQGIVNEFIQSGLNGKQFCSERDLGYLSFCKWRNRLSTAPTLSAPTFVDLTTLAAPNAVSAPATWHIVLKLGNGVELCLDQTHVPA